MRQNKYLFVGGPWDQQWREVPESYGRIIRVPAPPIERHRYVHPWDEGPQVVTYYGTRLRAPGWFVPVMIFTPDPVLPPPARTPLPGMVQGARLDALPNYPWTYLDNDEWRPGEAMHAAIRARGCRP